MAGQGRRGVQPHAYPAAVHGKSPAAPALRDVARAPVRACCNSRHSPPPARQPLGGADPQHGAAHPPAAPLAAATPEHGAPSESRPTHFADPCPQHTHGNPPQPGCNTPTQQNSFSHKGCPGRSSTPFQTSERESTLKISRIKTKHNAAEGKRKSYGHTGRQDSTCYGCVEGNRCSYCTRPGVSGSARGSPLLIKQAWG